MHEVFLDNGVRVILHPIPGLKSISCYGYFPFGVASEPIDQLGLTHLLEHLLPCGIDRYPSSRAISEAFERIGVHFEAVTGRDVVFFGIQSIQESFQSAFLISMS